MGCKNEKQTPVAKERNKNKKHIKQMGNKDRGETKSWKANAGFRNNSVLLLGS